MRLTKAGVKIEYFPQKGKPEMIKKVTTVDGGSIDEIMLPKAAMHEEYELRIKQGFTFDHMVSGGWVSLVPRQK